VSEDITVRNTQHWHIEVETAHGIWTCELAS